MKRLRSVFALAVFGFALILAGLASARAQSTTQSLPTIRPHGFEFREGDRSFRFVGFNIRGIAHYGHGEPLPASRAADIAVNLDGAAAAGAKVIRFFAAVNNADATATAARVEAVLDAMAARGLRGIPVLTDLYFYPWAAFHPAGDDKFYSDHGGWTILGGAFFSGGFREHYLPWVRTVVGRLRGHPAIFAWEIGNELKDPDTPANIIPFMREVAAEIKALDPEHMVTTGFMNWDHLGLAIDQGVALYSDPNLDFLTQHHYNFGDQKQNQVVYSRVAKPLIVEEYGWSLGDRVTKTGEAMAHYFNRERDRGVYDPPSSAEGFMHWGFQAGDHDIGDGDNEYGIDRYRAKDYDAMTALYRQWADALEQQRRTLPARAEPRGRRIAPALEAVRADSQFGEAGPARAFDGDATQGAKWTSDDSAGPHWLALDLGSPRVLDGLTLRLAGGDETILYNLAAMSIETAAGLDGPWTPLRAIDNRGLFSVRHEVFEPPAVARCLRLWITDAGIDNHARLTEWELYERFDPNAAADRAWLCAAP